MQPDRSQSYGYSVFRTDTPVLSVPSPTIFHSDWAINCDRHRPPTDRLDLTFLDITTTTTTTHSPLHPVRRTKNHRNNGIDEHNLNLWRQTPHHLLVLQHRIHLLSNWRSNLPASDDSSSLLSVDRIIDICSCKHHHRHTINSLPTCPRMRFASSCCYGTPVFSRGPHSPARITAMHQTICFTAR